MNETAPFCVYIYGSYYMTGLQAALAPPMGCWQTKTVIARSGNPVGLPPLPKGEARHIVTMLRIIDGCQ